MTSGKWPVLLSAGVFAGSAGLYLLFAGSFSGAEIATSLAAATAITAFVGLQHRGQSRRLRLRAPWLRLIKASLAGLALDTARVAAVLLRAVFVPGASHAQLISRQPFDAGGEQAGDAGRRALVTVASSLTPNSFVLDVAPSLLDGSDGALLLHQLAPAPLKADTAWPL